MIVVVVVEMFVKPWQRGREISELLDLMGK